MKLNAGGFAGAVTLFMSAGIFFPIIKSSVDVPLKFTPHIFRSRTC